MATAAPDRHELDIREQIARIDKMQAEIVKIRVDTKLAPVTLAAAAFGAGAALTAAIAGLVKLFGI